ncbi:MAG: MaoC family dehydratase N-terminal domain-containing protein [Chloroflexi bacterium]|nr:MaoC family dehydratase N-terminal domain-containing protein [Chloroflexota bacterium]
MSSLLGNLEPGHRFEDQSFTIDRETATSYANAVGDESTLAIEGKVPPMAVIALGLSQVIEALALGGGTVHASQEVEYTAPAELDQPIVASTVLKGNSVRRGSRFATVETTFSSTSGDSLARAVSMVIVPA